MTSTTSIQMRMTSGLTLLHLAIWASALQIGSMKMATDHDQDPEEGIHNNVYLDEEDFLSEFGLDNISNPGEKAKRRKALKENEEIIKRENVAFANGEKTWFDKMNEFDD